MTKIENILFDFWGVMLPEWIINIGNQLQKIFSIDDNEILLKIFNDIRPMFRNWIIDEEQRLNTFLHELRINTYDNKALNNLWDWMVNNYRHYNYKLQSYIVKLKNKWFKCIILSDTYPPLKERLSKKWFYDIFDNIILSCDTHISKKDWIMWTNNIFSYLSDFWINSENSIFIDDRPENCQFAKANKFKAILYSWYTQLKNDLSQYIN